MTADKLQDYANSLGHGHLKMWKAIGMMYDFPLIVSYGDDKERSLKWVKNCLEMEGFWSSDCEKVNDWLWENVK